MIELRDYIPKSLLEPYYRIKYWFRVLPLVIYDGRRFSRSSYSKTDEQSLIGTLTMAFHTVEKGFSMPEFRPLFASTRLPEFIDMAEAYVARFGTGNVQIRHIAVCILDYRKCHAELGIRLPVALAGKIDGFLSHFSGLESDGVQIDETSESFFAHVNSDFREFSSSRHSCRNFSDVPLETERIKEAVKLSQNAPSACNRQPARVIVVTDRTRIADVFLLHGGNRGFGHTVDKLIVVCGFLGCYNPQERSCVYTDAGLYTMNLSYALHYNKVGHCILNWSVSKEKDLAVRRILPVGDDEVICTLIACGNVPDKFKVCRSQKKETESIMRIC